MEVTDSYVDELNEFIRRDYPTYRGLILERYFRKKIKESKSFTDIGEYWNRTETLIISHFYITILATIFVYCQNCDIFVDIFFHMVTTNNILSFAFTHKVFTRKELIANLKSQDQINSSSSLSEQLARLLKSKLLVRIERGVYALPDNAKKDFYIVCSDEMKDIDQQIRTQFPFADYCIWSSSAIMSYMHHIPNLNFIYVDVEREVAESVFNLLNADNSRRAFLMPSQIDFDRYISGSAAIIIRPLISEAPLQIVEGLKTPAIEKILVDIAGDVEFSFLQGAEIYYVYANIFERHNINKNKLLRYASRRGRKQEVAQILNINRL